jgi:glycerol-3-phosphate dehydrogenase (NAD(P)+)
MTGADRAAGLAVVGAGSWGTAIAIHAARHGLGVRLWARDAELAERVAATGENRRYLPGIQIPPGVTVTSRLDEALGGAKLVVTAVPSAFLGAVARAAEPNVGRTATIVSATKGLEAERGRRMSEILAEALPGRPLAVLSGPSFAREVALGRPAALVVASRDARVARLVQETLAAPTFRLYTNQDVVGVEIGGALKNVVAVATGLCDSLDLGENARAALITRGLAEIERLGVALGAAPRTFAGLAGLGDLVLTCTGSLSRNHALGLAIGRGRTLAEAERATPMIAEGVRTVLSALRVAGPIGVAMPICEAVAAVLFAGQPIREALTRLLSREPRPEEEPADAAGRPQGVAP